MRKLSYTIVDVFTTTPLAGNPLAVFTDGNGLSRQRMQELAREMNLSETTFLQRAEGDATARIRIFTPRTELPFAGHPIVGTAFVIARSTPLHTIRFETGVGPIDVEVERDGGFVVRCTMTQPTPTLAPAEIDADLVSRALGQPLLKLGRRSPVPPHVFWALTRLGARVLIYGPLNTVIHPEVAQTWLESLLPFDPANDNERLGWAFCLAQLARKSGQRALDIDDSHRRSVLTALKGQTIPEHWARMVEEVVDLTGEEQGQMLGDTLPIGLRLLKSEE